jgi:hypothetical protein
MQNEQAESKTWTAEELLARIDESPAWERTGYRYCVIADETMRHFETKRALNREVSRILAKSPKVFRNADKGITIDFDIA